MLQPSPRLLLLALAGLAPSLAVVAAPSGAAPRSGLEMRVRADGVKVITNENAVQRKRRQATHRVAVPDPRLMPLIERESARHGFAPELVQAVIQAESGYNVRALSNKGAMGLMQLMPATAADLAVTDPYDPEQNVRAGTAYLKRLVDRFGHLELALAAYNAGPQAVERHRGIPPYPETEAYVDRVLHLFSGGGGSSRAFRPGKKATWVEGPNRRPLLTTEPP
jgi:soluble lytic murein transglycosylase-like protein